MKGKYNFSGYATKANVRCADGRLIRPDAFKEQDGITVPLVWQHNHADPANVLGHALLENRADGVYAYASFNSTKSGENAQALVEHGDIESLSIYANNLVEKSKDVLHGVIREVSLVLSGANPGAMIDNLVFAHGDGSQVESPDEAIIFSGLPIKMEALSHADTKTDSAATDKTIGDVIDTMNEEQKTAMYALMAQMLENAPDGAGTATHSDDEGVIMKHNVFEKDDDGPTQGTLSHDAMKVILADAMDSNASFKATLLKHAVTYGIENIDLLFPDAKTIANTPSMIQRRTEWVSTFLAGVYHNPWSRIKSLAFDITDEVARARGYVKGTMKKDEVIKLTKRMTGPKTIYKKQALDRDDVIDITDINVVALLKNEMRGMLEEEIARAALLSDGRDADDPDKINEENIRPVYKDVDMYVERVRVASNATVEDTIEAIIRSRKNYEGSGNPTMFTTTDFLTDMLLVKDTTGRRIYSNMADLMATLRVSVIVEVPVMVGVDRTTDETPAVHLNLLAIMLNMKDYVIGADKGGEINTFEDFDINFNKNQYLIETRISGCLTKPKSAIVIEQIGVAG